MGLRFTDCNKWQDPWFLELPSIGKLFWQYLCDKCDNAGVVHLSPKLIAVELGQEIDLSVALVDWFQGRVEVMPNGKWHLVKFVRFQHPGGLTNQSAVHRQVIRCMEGHGLQAFVPFLLKDGERGRIEGSLPSRLDSRTKAKDKDKDMDKVKDTDPVFGGMDADETPIELAKPFQEKVNWRDWRSQHGLVYVAIRGDGCADDWEFIFKKYGAAIMDGMYGILQRDAPGKSIYYNQALKWLEVSVRKNVKAAI